MAVEVKPNEKQEEIAVVGLALADEARCLKPFREALAEVFDAEDNYLANSTVGEVPLAVSVSRSLGDKLAGDLRALLARDPLNSASAGWAVSEITRADDDLEHTKRYAEALVIRAERRAERTRWALWPAIEEYVARVAPSKVGGKTWKFDGTNTQLRLVASKATVKVDDRKRLIEWAKSQWGVSALIERDVLKIREDVSEAALRDLVEEERQREAERRTVAGDLSPLQAPLIPGAAWTPEGDRLRIYR